MSEPGFTGSIASKSEAGRACPYCRFPLKEGAEVARCGDCGSVHHAECWRDNGGCAVLACASGPTTAGRRSGPPPTRVSPPPGPSAPPPPPPSSPSSRRPAGPSLAVAVVVLAVAVAGAAVAILLSGKGGGTHIASVANVTSAGTVTTVTTTTSTPTQQETTSTATTAAAGELPGVSGEQMQGEIQAMLREWHEDVVAGDYRGAWQLLSARKRAQDEDEEGYATWVKNQSTLKPYLNPANLQVSLEATEPESGVAQVDVTGMGWDKPGASCSEWSGITWVKYEDGAWRYDPGYSTTPQREREFKPRYPELLGGRC
jgi:hypothetical protein